MKNIKLFPVISAVILIIAFVGIAYAYEAILDTPENQDQITRKVVERIEFVNNGGPGEADWNITISVKKWAQVGGSGDWYIVSGNSTEQKSASASIFFANGGSMEGQATAFKTRIKELLILANIISADDTWQ